MKRLLVLMFIVASAFTACDVIKNIPTNTSGGFFSLNGTWSLTSTNEGSALSGSTITVYPVTGSATFTTLANNTYCARERDALWKDIKSTGSGVFSVNALATACNNSTVYRAATITVISTDQVRLSGQTASGAELLQTWQRIK
jgi:hypothetical protein